MKRNLLSILILGLLIVNIVLTSIMMFSVVSANKKTARLVDSIATAMSLEMNTGAEQETAAVNVPMKDIEIYNVDGSMTIPLRDGSDGESHFAIVSVAFSINIKDPGYKTYGSDLSAQESLIKNEINAVFAQYQLEEAKASQEQIKSEILARVQALYDSEFIFNVSFSEIVFQ